MGVLVFGGSAAMAQPAQMPQSGLSVDGPVAEQYHSPPAAHPATPPDPAISPQFQQHLLDSIDRTLTANPAPEPAQSGDTAIPSAGQQATPLDVDLSPSLAAAMREGMTGIRPVAKFPSACMPIMGVPNTGINPLLANASSGSVHISVLAEMSGGLAAIGQNWRDGIALAAKIINDNGGLLGRPIELKTFDVADPSKDRAAASAALDFNPFVVLGPVTSGPAFDTMDVLKQVQIPQLVGTRGLTDTPNTNPYLFRTGTTAIEEVVEIGTYLRDQRNVHRIVIVSSDSDYGEDSRMMLAAGMMFSNIQVTDDIRVEPETTDFKEIARRVKAENPDVVAVFLSQAESAKFLIDARGLGLDQPVLLDSLVIGPDFLKLAGEAANGAIGLVGLNAQSPVIRIRELVDEFKKAYGYGPSPVALQGFIAMNMVKAVVDTACSLNGPDFIKAAKGLEIDAKAEPGVLMNFSFGSLNNVIRDNFLFEIRNQRVSIVAMLPVTTLPF